MVRDDAWCAGSSRTARRSPTWRTGRTARSSGRSSDILATVFSTLPRTSTNSAPENLMKLTRSGPRQPAVCPPIAQIKAKHFLGTLIFSFYKYNISFWHKWEMIKNCKIFSSDPSLEMGANYISASLPGTLLDSANITSIGKRCCWELRRELNLWDSHHLVTSQYLQKSLKQTFAKCKLL